MAKEAAPASRGSGTGTALLLPVWAGPATEKREKPAIVPPSDGGLFRPVPQTTIGTDRAAGHIGNGMALSKIKRARRGRCCVGPKLLVGTYIPTSRLK